MPVIASADEAEGVADEWLKHRFEKKVARTKFSQVTLENGTWTLKADVLFKGGILAQPKKTLVVRVDSQSTQIVGYSELPEEK
jgi:hypothetical protein